MMFPKRKSPRIPYYDYSSANYYFITICTHEKKCLFGMPGRLTQMGNIVQQQIESIESHYDYARIDRSVVMPNHVHMILVIEQDQQADAVQIIGQFKSGVTRMIRKMKPGIRIWQRSFHDHVIRDQSGYEKISNYIEGNPAKWEEDCFYIPDL